MRYTETYDCPATGCGDHTGAGELMIGLLASEPRNAQFLAWQVRRLLTGGNWKGAWPWLRNLQKVEPDTPRTRALLAQMPKD